MKKEKKQVLGALPHREPLKFSKKLFAIGKLGSAIPTLKKEEVGLHLYSVKNHELTFFEKRLLRKYN